LKTSFQKYIFLEKFNIT